MVANSAAAPAPNLFPCGDIVNHSDLCGCCGSGRRGREAEPGPDPQVGPARRDCELHRRQDLKTLKRHLSSHGLDPRSYRDRYGLPADYPMVAPGYAEQRSALAKAIGLG